MNIQNNSNVSFKASFRFAEQTDCSFTQEQLKNVLTKPASTGKDILDFMAYIYSDEGRAQLDKLPKEDTVELMLFEETEKGKVFVDPYFYYYSDTMPNSQRINFETMRLEGKPSQTNNLKETFISWTDKIAEFLK